MPTETKIQSIIHKLEEGGWARWLKLAVLLSAVVVVFYLSFFGSAGFKGLYHPHAFEQAEIARELARGHGFSTQMHRPAALFQFREHHRSFPADRMPDTYHAPLWSTVLAPFVWMNRSSWEMDKTQFLYPSDRAVAMVSTAFFLLSVLVNYFLARRLFDDRLALIGVGLLLVSDHLWQFSLSGLPQMFMLFLFSCAMYCVLRAVERREEILELARPAPELPEDGLAPEANGDASEILDGPVQPKPPVLPYATAVQSPFLRGPVPWLLGASLLFSALALTHALTIWAFFGVVLFCAIYFRPYGLYAALMLAIVGLCYAPWMVRNYQVCGSPFGVGLYSGMQFVRGDEPSIMRSMDPPFSGLAPAVFRRKILSQTEAQLFSLWGYLGGVVAAPFFFIALLHIFRRRSTSVFRWCVLCSWLVALFGMSLFGMDFEALKANDLHVLFIPLTTFYGLAFILVLWSRLEIRVRLARVAFMSMLFVLSGYTFVISFMDLLVQGQRVQWPPYIPPYIALIGSWTKPSEIIMSDMPWAVAWYGDRKALWVPLTIKNFIDLNDWEELHGRIVGLYLTPISGDAPYLSGVKKGGWSEWSPFIERTANLKNFPLKAVTPLPRDQMCVYYSDRDRWTLRED